MTCWYSGRLRTWISARLRKFLYNVLQVKIVLRPISALPIHKNHQLQPGVSIKLLHSFSSEKYKRSFLLLFFLVSLAHKNKSVKLKMHKHKKSNVSKISVREVKREKNNKTSIYSSLKELSRSSTKLSS